MLASAFDRLSRALARAGSRRRLLGVLIGVPLAGLLTGVGDVVAKPGRKAHRHHAQHQHRQAKTQRRKEQRHDAHSAACIPTGQRCPSRKPRGKKGKKLSCAQCCQGTFVTDAAGKKVCGCQPNGGTCTSATASACCSGFCAGTTCQAAPCSAATPVRPVRPAAPMGSVRRWPTAPPVRTGNACTQSDVCQGGVCVAGSALPDGTSCGSGQVCCGGGCLSGTCCANAACAGTPTTPICSAAHTCVACTSSSQCPSGQICLLEGSCQACDVSCPSGRSGHLRDRLAGRHRGGGTHYVCPGIYRAPAVDGFTPSAAGVSLVGAGEGSDPATATILDATGTGGRVLTINAGVGLVVLQRLRVTGATTSLGGAGIFHLGTTLRMTECTVAGNTATNSVGGGLVVDASSTLEMTRCTVRDNHATGSDGNGGGIVTFGTTTLTDCLIENNSADNVGGGIYVSSGTTTLVGSTTVQGNHADALGRWRGHLRQPGTLIIAPTCRVTRNTAPAGRGGGIFNAGGTVTLQGAAMPSPIVVDNCQENCAPMAAVPNCSTAPPAGPCP